MMASKRQQQGLFSQLPRELRIEILSRLSIQSSIQCKLVCKEWLEVVESPDFLRFHHSRVKPHLLVLNDRRSSKLPSKIFELDDENCSEKVEMNFKLNIKLNCGMIHGSVNGLILLGNIFICNPTTRQILRLPNPPDEGVGWERVINWGFGVSRRRGQYKIVRMVVCGRNGPPRPLQSFYQVYTLGTGSWRYFKLEEENMSALVRKSICAFANGNLHWMEYGFDSRLRICRFDLETEAFTSLSPPTRLYGPGYRTLTALGSRLCLCDNTATAELVVWMLNDDEAWTKEYVVAKIGVYNPPMLFPIKVFQDGEMMLIGEGCWGYVFSCSNNAKATLKYPRIVHSFCFHRFNAIFYTPSFLPLKSKVIQEELASF